MGLDQYLTKRTYVKNWNHFAPEQRWTITVFKGRKVTPIQSERISEIKEEVAYWRKANQIHAWFVDHVQNGSDDCTEYYVTRDQLQLLVDTCQCVLDNIQVKDGRIHTDTQYHEGCAQEIYKDGKIIVDSTFAEQMLPATPGFFFGSTDYDERYIKDLEYTVKVLTQELASEPSTGAYYYQSSW